MKDRNLVLMEIIREEIRKELIEEKLEKDKKKALLMVVYKGNTYTHLDSFCETNIEYFGLNADNFKRSLYQKGLIDYNGTRYIPHENMDSVAIFSKDRLYLNRDMIDSMLMLYLVERMSIKNIRDAFDDKLKSDKHGFIKELYDVSNAEFQRNSPVFEDIRLGTNKKSQIDM